MKNYGCRLMKFLIYNNRIQWVHHILIEVIGKKNYYSFLSRVESGSLDKIKIRKQPVNIDKPIVFLMFDGRMEQAGLADNLRAAASVFHLCKLLNRDFKIVFNYPFRLEEYLTPNRYNWCSENDNKSYLASNARDLVAMSYRDLFDESNEGLQKQYLEKKMANDKFVITRLYTNTSCFDCCFYESYHELFKPSEKLKDLIEEQLQLIGGSFVSISFRFANLLGDLDDNFGHELSEEEKVGTISKCISIIEKIFKGDKCRILVTSDSKRFTTEVRMRLQYIYVIPGDIGHVGHNGNDGVVIKTFLDLYVISHAEKVYMARTPFMYRSGFAQRAAMIGNKPFKEIIL